MIAAVLSLLLVTVTRRVWLQGVAPEPRAVRAAK
jgi:hypothetical protein